MLYCFLDTNILLQYKTFDEIDWCKELGAKPVTLVIPLEVIDELDRHKNHPSSDRIRKRTRLILGKLFEQKEIRPNVSLLLLDKEPNNSWFESNGFDKDNSDSRIIGTAKWFADEKSQTGSTPDMILVSEDRGFQLRARSYKCISLNDSLKLPDEPDPAQAEIKALQKQLTQLQNAQPKLSIGFSGENSSLLTELTYEIDFEPIALTGEDIRNQVEAKKESLRYNGLTQEVDEKSDKSEARLTVREMIARDLMQRKQHPSKSEVDIYHNAVERYAQNYGIYLASVEQHKIYIKRLKILNFVLANDGSLPAENIDVWIHIPDGLLLESKVRKYPELPTPPDMPKPKSPADELLRSITPNIPYIPHGIYGNPQPSLPTPPPTSSLRFRRTNSYEIDLHLDHLKHYFAHTWNSLYIVFEPPVNLPSAMPIEYEITAGNMRDKVAGKLLIRLNAPAKSEENLR